MDQQIQILLSDSKAVSSQRSLMMQSEVCHRNSCQFTPTVRLQAPTIQRSNTKPCHWKACRSAAAVAFTCTNRSGSHTLQVHFHVQRTELMSTLLKKCWKLSQIHGSVVETQQRLKGFLGNEKPNKGIPVKHSLTDNLLSHSLEDVRADSHHQNLHPLCLPSRFNSHQTRRVYITCNTSSRRFPGWPASRSLHIRCCFIKAANKNCRLRGIKSAAVHISVGVGSGCKGTVIPDLVG